MKPIYVTNATHEQFYAVMDEQGFGADTLAALALDAFITLAGAEALRDWQSLYSTCLDGAAYSEAVS